MPVGAQRGAVYAKLGLAIRQNVNQSCTLLVQAGIRDGVSYGALGSPYEEGLEIVVVPCGLHWGLLFTESPDCKALVWTCLSEESAIDTACICFSRFLLLTLNSCMANARHFRIMQREVLEIRVPLYKPRRMTN